MRMLLAAISVLFASSGGAAFAGCANYVDGSTKEPAPRAKVCFGGKCENVTMNYECGNVFGTEIEYSNGWHIEYGDPRATEEDPEAQKIVKVYRVLKPEEVSKITCKALDDDACRFPDKPKP